MDKYIPKKIFIDQEVIDLPFTQRILNNLPLISYEVISQPENLIKKITFLSDPITHGKKYLLITKQKGNFVKPCPGTPHYICCNYYIINLALNCPLECTYCILQYYLNNPLITVYANLDDLFNQLDNFLSQNKNNIYRIGTGELTDSLVLDHFTQASKDLISYFAKSKNAIFELKTKTTNINDLFGLDHRGKTVVSWSLNSEEMVKYQEIGTPSNQQRLKAAKEIVNYGYRVGFHFDPIIFHPGWEKDYQEIIKKLFSNISPKDIAWISLGSLRFQLGLKSIIEKRFPKTRIIYHEFISGRDGKYRYFKPLRLKVYQRIVQWIRKYGGDEVFIYYCMESEEIWRKTLGWVPKSKEELGNKLCYLLG
ncbi:MAG: radical SAM protein [Candidatus Aminicenantia bacterium]